MGVKCFWLEPTGDITIELRRYAGDQKCPSSGLGYHNASVQIPERAKTDKEGITRLTDLEEQLLMEKYSNSFPTQCSCGYTFTDDDNKQLSIDELYRRSDNGELIMLRNAPPGAMWDAFWYKDAPEWTGPDGRSIIAVCPGGSHWNIDGRASNCNMPCLHCGVPYDKHKNYEEGDNHRYEDLRPHKCWVRHGEPPMITVDKNGVTCGAGAGSIATKNYHGFLRNGAFT